MTKITREVAHDIRILYKSGEYTQTELAKKFEVSQPLISKIVNWAIHKGDANVVMSGEAKVKVGYKHGN